MQMRPALMLVLLASISAVAKQEPDQAAGPLKEAISAVEAGKGDQGQALFVVERAANGGDAKAQNALCNAYRLGRGVPQDKAAALRWCLEAGEQGEAQAQHSLGEICSAGGRRGSKMIAALWYRKAADQGLAEAQFALGEAYEDDSESLMPAEGPAARNPLGWYRMAAEQGNARAQFRLGAAYDEGKHGLTADSGIAIEWFHKAARRGLAEAQARLGDKFAEGNGVAPDLEQAYGWYLKVLDSGGGRGSAQLRGPVSDAFDGLAGLAGMGFAPAAELIRREAERGRPQAQRSMARMSAQGQDADRNLAAAFQWYRRLEKRHPDAAIIGFGDLAEKGHTPALDWIQGLAAQGNGRAQLELGRMHAQGRAVAQDGSQAAEWLFLAASSGNAPALGELILLAGNGNRPARRHLGELAEQGSPRAQLSISVAAMSEDMDLAIASMRRAAEQNHSWAQAMLGFAQFLGMEGMKRDPAASAEWLQKAAEQGIAMAQLLLGYMHYTGEAVSKDLVQAYGWFRAAMEQAHAREISALAQLMDLGMGESGAMIEEFNDRAARILGPERLVQAQQLAREYRRRHVFPYQCGLLADRGGDEPEILFSFDFERAGDDSQTAGAAAGREFAALGRQVVTGSRIRRIDMEEARPMVVITREDIELSGRESVADVLRNSPVNSLGSSREQSGHAWIGQAAFSLHGIGANRTLVLLDGRRAPRSPITANQAVDLNIIPLAAVERIEILTDSASAIYGSDAIGGVVNIILRKRYEGIEAATSLARPSREGADTESGMLTLGGASERGRFLFSADFRNKEHIASADRFYTLGTTGHESPPAAYPQAPFTAAWRAWENADNVSSWGNTIWPHRKAAPNCEQVLDPATGRRLLAGPYVSASGEEHCGFHYAAAAWETTDLQRASAFLHAEYELSSSHALRLQSLFSAQNVHGRLAPPPGDILLAEAAAAGLERGFDFGVPYPELLPYTLRHRFAGLGGRNFEALLTLHENALLAHGGAGIFHYQLEARHTRYAGRENSCCFPRAFATQAQVSQGLYNPFDPLHPGNAAALQAIAAKSTRDSRADLRSYSGNVGFDFLRTRGGPVSWAFGFDYFDEKYRDRYDPLSSGGGLLGRFGVSGAGERVIRALFGEALAPLLPNLQLSAALRWDQYDDSAGSELSSYFSARYQPAGWLLLRASWGEGFRAGSMNNLYDGTSLWLQTGFDLVKCRRDGIAPTDCIEEEVPTYTGGNPALRPELSESYNLGVVAAWNSLTARADFWNVDLENGIGLPPLQGLIGLEFEGQCLGTGRIENTRYSATAATMIRCGSGSLLKRHPATGALLEADVFWDNTYRAQFRGVDLQLIYDLPTAALGDFQFRLHAGTILRLRTRSRTASQWSSGLGAVSGSAAAAGARPSERSSAAIIWRYGDHTVSGHAHYVGGFGLPEVEFSISAHTEFDLFYQWSAPWNGRITAGLRNLTDEDPELGSFRTPLPQAYNLYSLDGRVLYASYRQSF